MMNVFKFAPAFAFAAVAMAGTAFADDFIAQCTAYDKNPEAAKICACASEKLPAADRAAAIEAMKAVNAATASGKPEDAALMTTQHAKGLEAVMTAEMSCM